MEFLVHARNQLERDGQGVECSNTQWRANGNDPSFELMKPDGSSVTLACGWYWLDIVMLPRDTGGKSHPKLYVDYGAGYLEVNALHLDRLVGRKGIAGVVCFIRDVHGLRFDPLDTEGRFSLGRLRVAPISKAWAAFRMFGSILVRESNRLGFIRTAALQAWRARVSPRGFGDWLYKNYRGIQTTHVADYASWVSQFDTYTRDELKGMARNVHRLARQPLISIIMPTYNSPERWLSRCIDSVRQQVYPHWELCIADDASTAPHVRKVLRRYAKLDERIKVAFRERNGHISEASNTALDMASGEWIALLDHDDELPPHALYAVAREINEHPEARMIYSDEDKIDGLGQRFDPYFKSDWNYDLFLGQNMVNHLGVYHADLMRKVGGFRKGLEGSQDYDLALRFIEQIGPDQIRHIPRVLYHWRAIEGSTAVSMDEKNYAAVAAQRALREHLARISEQKAEVEVYRYGYRVRRHGKVGDPTTKISLIVPTRDRVELLRMCVESILAHTEYPNYEIVVVDNQSSDPAALAYFEQIRVHPKVRVLHYDAPFNFSAINNHAVAHCDGDVIGLVNNDIEAIHSDWLREMVSQAIRPEIGAVGAMLYYPNDTIQHAGVLLGIGGVAGHAYCGWPRGYYGMMSRGLLVQQLSAVTAACLLVRRSVYEEVGGLDPKLQVAFNDIDFCLRVRAAGYNNLWTPYAELYHHESASRGLEDTPAKKQRFEGEVAVMLERWGEALNRDPAYSPNLSLKTAQNLAFPPRLARLS